MNFDRIGSSIKTDRMRASSAALIGGTYGLAADLVRCGLGRALVVDFDRFEPSNIQRQDVTAEDAARNAFKTHACARQLRAINPDMEVETLERDICALSDEDVEGHFGHRHVLIFATDSFAAQAKGNLIALKLGIPAIWIGLYPLGRAGEVIFWRPGLACYRCIAGKRYAAFASVQPRQTRTSSDGGTILDLRLVDSIAGHIAVGLLTRGADNRFGRLIDQLGNRNLLQVKIDPGYTLNGTDIFAHHLGESPANFSFTTIALSMEPDPTCPDCGGRRAGRA